jgi:hypothetical protein
MTDGQQPATNALEIAPSSESPSNSGITARAVVLGLILVIGFTVAGCFSVLLRYEIIGTGYLPRGAVCLLLALLAGNGVLRHLRRRGIKLALSANELLLVFAMLLVAGAIPGQEFAQHVYLNTVGIVYYTTPDIAPPDLYLDGLDPALVPSVNREEPVIRWAFEGLPPGASFPWRPWVKPLLVWTPLFLALYWMVLCFSTLLAHRWEREERLLYPLVQVPVEIVAGEPLGVASPLRNSMLWIAFGLCCALFTYKMLHAYIPSIPDINLQKSTETVMGGPYAAFNRVPIHFYPEMVGVSYLLTAEVGFSLWVFYWFRRIQQFIRMAVGVDAGHYQFFRAQTIGGYAVLAAALLWSAREHLSRAFAVTIGALRRNPDDPDADEPYRLAVLGFIGALIFVIAWCSHFGASATWAAVQYMAFPLVGMVVARVVSEAGILIYTSPFRINDTIFEIAGSDRLKPQDVTVLTMTSWTQIRSTATTNMAAVAQGLKIGSEMGASRTRMMFVAMAAITAAVLVSHITSLYVIYNWGVPKLGWWPRGSSLGATNNLVRFIAAPGGLPAGDWIGMALGGAITWALVVLRRQFVWWPLHPLGFVTWLGWPIDRYWLSIFIGWILKFVVVRFGGYQAYNRIRPAAFGLILGVAFIVTVSIVVHFFYPAPPLIIE